MYGRNCNRPEPGLNQRDGERHLAHGTGDAKQDGYTVLKRRPRTAEGEMMDPDRASRVEEFSSGSGPYPYYD